MFDPLTTVRISLGSALLDRPDRSGEYFAKDMAGGWAYLVNDAEGDQISRGQGVCEGGLDATLRRGFLSATNHALDCDNIAIIVESQRAHRAMVQLATHDPSVVAAIGGRPVVIMTRPKERAAFQVKAAAERAASSVLKEREHAELFETAAKAANTGLRGHKAQAPDVQERDMTAMLARRLRSAAEARSAPIAASAASVMVNDVESTRPVRSVELAPHIDSASGSPLQQSAPATADPTRSVVRNGALAEWLVDLDSHVATLKNHLYDVGA